MRIICSALLVLGFAISSANAKVLIYKGTDKLTGDVSNSVVSPANPLGVYIVVDFETHQSLSILYFKLNGQKKFQASAPQTQSMAIAQLKGGRTATILGGGETVKTDFQNFRFNTFFLQGVNSTVTVQTSPTPVVANRPRLIAGSVVDVRASDGDGTFANQKILITYQAKQSIAANDAGKSIGDVGAAITADLVAKGYVAP